MMGTWGVLLCCAKPGGNFLEMWGSWEDADAVGATPGPSWPV